MESWTTTTACRTLRRALSFPLVALAALFAVGCAGGPSAGSPAAAPAAQGAQAQQAGAQQVAQQADLEPVWSWDTSDPRLALRPGGQDAEYAQWGMELMVNMPLPDGFGTNSDLAFGGNWAFVGNYNGINVYDVSDPANPSLRLSLLCPGNQGDVSVHGNLMFKSVQAASSRLDCGTQGVEGTVSPERFRGVRIFDISNIDEPRQVAAVQTCRGSHTHSLATRPGDEDHVYVYVSGTSGVRPGEELEGCSGLPPEEDPGTSLFQIEVIRVPLAAPHQAAVVNEPRVFADAETGEIAGLHGLRRDGTFSPSPIRACHDITTYPAIGLAGGACSGNGLLLDITDPENPVRIDEVADSNFAYWHSATFNNDGTTVIFTDEWGGGSSPRCREIDPPEWGGNAIFDIVDGRLVHRSYYKLPVPIEPTCVAHNGSLIPVPGRDIKVQSWYEGGISVFDFTDSADPYEIAYFNRGPSTSGGGGFWSAYWYNGHIYGAELGRGLDIFRLVPNEHLTENEIEAAMSVRMDKFNAQHQPRIEWPATFALSRAYLDQLERAGAMPAGQLDRIRGELAAAERLPAGAERRAAADGLVALAGEIDPGASAGAGVDNATRVRGLLAASLRELAATLR
jgi:hypothetical protein